MRKTIPTAGRCGPWQNHDEMPEHAAKNHKNNKSYKFPVAKRSANGRINLVTEPVATAN
jgi:hypothetical protein